MGGRCWDLTPPRYLGNSRIILNHFDAATQADIQHVALSYESEDETMGRLYARSRRGTALYSKQDIREQYCISDRGLGALETSRASFFSCLSSHQHSPCSNKTNLLTVCVRQKIPSDENLHDLYKRHPIEYAPYPRRPRYPWITHPPDIYRDEELNSNSYFRRKVHIDPAKYTWMPSDDESVRMERPRSVLDSCPAHLGLPPPPPPAQRPKHVSFARSHTLTSFDDASVMLGSSTTHISKMSRSQERLIDVRKSPLPLPITRQPEPSENVLVLEKIKKAPMKTQATQTEACLGRKPLPPNQLNLSPRTIHRVKMVSQGAQTNGILINGRKLMKSYSEAGRFGITFGPETRINDLEHEPLQRTQSDEPPRSPYLAISPPTLPPEVAPCPPSDSSSVTKSDHESEESETKCQKEIFIDFKPITHSQRLSKKPLMKTSSDGEILLDQRRAMRGDIAMVPDKPLMSLSHEDMTTDEEPINYTPYFKNEPIRHEGIFKDLGEHIFSSIDESIEGNSFMPQDSIDEEFHENFIYNKMYIKNGSSTSDQELERGIPPRIAEELSPVDESVVPSLCLLPDRKLSPFASSDSLANDIRDHSDGIWNESQATVLQADSGTENGTALSSSEMTSLTATSPGAISLLTPSSRRKHLLLLQHQQRSSMDTEALDEELPEQIQVCDFFLLLQHQQRSSMDTEALDEELPEQIQIQSPSSPRMDVPNLPMYQQDINSKQQYLTPRRARSPAWKRRTPEPPSESPLPAVVPDLLLARTDSGRTNTDISESTTTTDDYITANSGTDSSRKSNSTKGNSDKHRSHTTAPEGSSFESASSIYSGSKVDYLSEDMVVPSYSPPPIPEETSDMATTPVPEVHTGRSSPTGSSSSSGSYSLNGSCPELPQKPPVPSIKQKASLSEDDRSVHYSSSGYYESPLEDDATWKSSKSDKVDYHREEETKRKKRPYTLEVSKSESSATLSNGKTTKFVQKHGRKLSPSRETIKFADVKTKRGKVRTRSPMQNHKKAQYNKKSPQSIRKPDEWVQSAHEEGKLAATSDESSSGVCGEKKPEQTSPRKSKKLRDSSRRKSAPRSPTGSKTRRRNSNAEEKSLSLPGSLSRRKSSVHLKTEDEENSYSGKTKLHPHSPSGSPTKRRRSPKGSPDAARLKALSAESLRSVSPGSDSVFYSDPSSHAAAIDHQVHCLHCGKEVDIVTTDDHEKSISSNGLQPDIVQPPAGFEDSPRQKHTTGRLYKKLEKRFRSEERCQAERRHFKYRSDVRAKSEERGEKSEPNRGKLRPMARSTDAGVEGLRATDSSPSVLPGAPEDEDDLGLYNVPYSEGCWIYIGDQEEIHTWSRPESSTDDDAPRRDSTSSIESTESEHEFRKRYQAVTHRMVHRKSCLEMYKRQASKSFGKTI
ncbi:hypothetical protein QE152_g37855 [Popillia japonica]|uniref:Uncharacterized protein n=1 Tax=Popillia japonica TaxID=7064 RepID=A0AAW1I9K3_POPJA